MPAAQLLVVEDETVVALHLEQSLKSLGYAVSVVHTGEDAIAQAAATRPDLALMDIKLSGKLDGIDAAECLRKRCGIPVVYLTAYADEDTIQRAGATEPAGYLLKPFRDRELHATVQIALRRASIERNLRQQQQWHLAMLDTVSDPLITVDRERKVTFVNRAAEAMLGCRPEEACGKDVVETLASRGGDRKRLEGALAEALREGVAAEVSGPVVVNGGGESGTYQAGNVVPLQEGHRGASGLLLAFRKVVAPGQPPPESPASGVPAPAPTEPPHSPAIQPSSRTDALTGLPGRDDAEDVLAGICQDGRRAFAVVFCIDRFRAMEARFGRPAAEEVILFYSVHLAQGLTAGDQLFRWSGPAFLAVIERPNSIEAVRRETASLASVRLEKVLHVRARTALVIVSAAWNVLPVPGALSLDQLVRQIDSFVEERTA